MVDIVEKNKNFQQLLQLQDNELKELQNNLKRMEKGTNRSANVQLSQTCMLLFLLYLILPLHKGCSNM